MNSVLWCKFEKKKLIIIKDNEWVLIGEIVSYTWQNNNKNEYYMSNDKYSMTNNSFSINST